MKKMFDHEVDRIKEDFRTVCRTFLDVYGFASEVDATWGATENHTDQFLWNRIGELERELEAVAPGTGPRYDRSEPEETCFRRIALWCEIEDASPVEAVPDAKSV